MQNIQDDKYWYLSGEAKRSAVAYDVKAQLKDLQKETDRKFQELEIELAMEEFDREYIKKMIEQSHDMSVKPGVKVANKRKKVELSKKALAVGACVIYIVGGVTMPHLMDMAKNVHTSFELNKVIVKEINEFSEEVVVPNTTFDYARNDETNEKETIHWHDSADIVMNAKQQHEDPIVAFYIVYASLDEYCRKNDIGSILDIYNRLYGTHYEGVDDFLIKNGFTSLKEWKAYVGNVLMEKEATLDGSSNSRGQ